MSERDRTRNAEELVQLIYGTWSPFWGFYAKANPAALWEETREATLCSFGLPHPLFNQVVEFAPDISSETVDRVCDRMNALGLPWFWFGNPSTWHESIPPRALERGLVPVTSVKGMVFDSAKRSINTQPPIGLEVHEVQDKAGVDAFANGILPAYEMPVEFASYFSVAHERLGFYPQVPVRSFYGVWEGRPVTGSMVFFVENTAVIQCVATHPEARGHGFAQAVVSACMQAAKAEGYRYIVLQASDMGYPVYLKMGYEELFDQPVYMIPPSEEATP